ncbi:ADP-ribosylhydrolase ARH1-like isoform X1 [Haliotis cracherodii]|uniref:ADP-ribosylhydrolase ARH1-like isoform X1 n=2 Tax=Haliotis cracherodii TaxID=6455 RepID=UPI0039E797A5
MLSSLVKRYFAILSFGTIWGMAATKLAPVSMLERYKAAMVLAGVGDALGYKKGEWEFCHSGQLILKDLKKMGGLEKIKVNKRDWMVSDDTVMHLATGEALVSEAGRVNRVKTYHEMAHQYKVCMRDMAGRAPGATCMAMVHSLKPDTDNGYKIPFNSRGGGCGASMRAMCIGLRYPRHEDLNDLIAVSIESGRMTHHHPTGYLGALASALFTAYSIQGKPPVEWGQGLLDVLPQALKYIKDSNYYANENEKAWPYFKEHWEAYVDLRKLKSGEPEFPSNYDDPDVRDDFYKSISFGGWGGASGHDSTIIAYDAILGAGQDWKQLCMRGMFHGGDSDSTGTIAACCYGAMYGFEGVPEGNYKKLEYKDRLEKLAEKLYDLAQTNEVSQNNPVGMAVTESSEVDPKQIQKDSKNEDKEKPMEMEGEPTNAEAEEGKGHGSLSEQDKTEAGDHAPPKQEMTHKCQDGDKVRNNVQEMDDDMGKDDARERNAGPTKDDESDVKAGETDDDSKPTNTGEVKDNLDGSLPVEQAETDMQGQDESSVEGTPGKGTSV